MVDTNSISRGTEVLVTSTIYEHKGETMEVDIRAGIDERNGNVTFRVYPKGSEFSDYWNEEGEYTGPEEYVEEDEDEDYY